MTTYIIRLLLHAFLLILILSLVVFFVMRLLPGDPVLMLITSDELAQTSGERLAQLLHEFDLDKLLLLHYGTWQIFTVSLASLARFNSQSTV